MLRNTCIAIVIIWFNSSVHNCNIGTQSKQEAAPAVLLSRPSPFVPSKGERREKTGMGRSTCLVHPGASPPLTMCYFKHITLFQGAIQIKMKKKTVKKNECKRCFVLWTFECFTGFGTGNLPHNRHEKCNYKSCDSWSTQERKMFNVCTIAIVYFRALPALLWGYSSKRAGRWSFSSLDDVCETECVQVCVCVFQLPCSTRDQVWG